MVIFSWEISVDWQGLSIIHGVKNEWSVKKWRCKVNEHIQYEYQLKTQVCKKSVDAFYQFNFYFEPINASFVRILEDYSLLKQSRGYLETQEVRWAGGFVHLDKPFHISSAQRNLCLDWGRKMPPALLPFYSSAPFQGIFLCGLSCLSIWRLEILKTNRKIFFLYPSPRQ